MTFGGKRKLLELHISCGLQGIFSSDVRATIAMLGRQVTVSLYC